MFESNDHKYTSRFHRHVLNFMVESGLLKKDSRFLVAVSGGIDSMALLHFLKQLGNYGYSCSLKAVHINHGTRPEQQDEANMVQEFCRALGVDFEAVVLKDLDVHRNFEFEARKKRYQALRKIARKEDALALGHHIDDSFEWTILQSLRSSNLEGSLGIPVKNGSVVRPFMCVTKQQIKRYIEAFDLPFLEDPTNEATRHERNYIRAQISEGFASRYPKYLKHYVHRHNELARRLGKHISLKDQCDFENYYGKDHVEIVSFKGAFNPSGLEFKILQAMNYLAPNGRGSLSTQIAKIILALKNHKSGPMSLFKGIKVYMSFNHLLICAPNYRSMDKKIAQGLGGPNEKYLYKEFGYDEYVRALKEVYQSKNAQGAWPLWVIVRQKRFNFEAANGHPQWSELFQKASKTDTGQIVQALKLLRYWAKPKNRNKRLSLRLLLSL